jgi:hypothetical protein
MLLAGQFEVKDKKTEAIQFERFEISARESKRRVTVRGCKTEVER